MRTLITALGSAMAVALLATPAPASAQAAVEAAMNKAGCLACHAKDKKMVGPAYKDVAAKYKGQGDAVAVLSAKIRNGGTGNWGQIPMPPHPADKISDADLKAAVEWILKL